MPGYRPHYLGQLNWFNLNFACEQVARAFDSHPYLVGSSLEHSGWRDVDVRLMMSDEDFAHWFPNQPPDPTGKQNDPAWAFICNAISEWLSARTGLPVDFQIQQRTAANKMFSGQRNALGIFIDPRVKAEGAQ